MKIIAMLMDSLGALKWMKSAKATLSIAGVATVISFIQDAMLKNYPWQVTVAGAIAVAIVTAALVIAQGKVDTAKAENPVVMENVAGFVTQPATIPQKSEGMDMKGIIGFIMALGLFSLVAACGKPAQVNLQQPQECGSITSVTMKIFNFCSELAIDSEANITIINTSVVPNELVTVTRAPENATYVAQDVTICDTTYVGTIVAEGYESRTDVVFEFTNTYMEVFVWPEDDDITRWDESVCETIENDPTAGETVAFRSAMCSCLSQMGALPDPPIAMVATCCDMPYLTTLTGFVDVCGYVPPRFTIDLCQGLLP